MNSTIVKVALAYLAGIGTYELFQHHNLSGRIDTMSTQIMMMDSGDTSAAAGELCPCDNADRYNVVPREESMNVPITTIPQCSTMVSNGNPPPSGGGTITGKGAWFSKVTLDNMFCHKPDANGIYVYKAQTEGREPTFIIEAARSNKINSTDDGTSYIYYSRAMCPTICGVCGM